jgi:elongation factor Ts
MKKFTGEVSLTGQAFIMEPKKSVGEVLKEKYFFRRYVGK